jgi:hypothetical protein
MRDCIPLAFKRRVARAYEIVDYSGFSSKYIGRFTQIVPTAQAKEQGRLKRQVNQFKVWLKKVKQSFVRMNEGMWRFFRLPAKSNSTKNDKLLYRWDNLHQIEFKVSMLQDLKQVEFRRLTVDSKYSDLVFRMAGHGVIIGSMQWQYPQEKLKKMAEPAKKVLSYIVLQDFALAARGFDMHTDSEQTFNLDR